MQQVLIDACGWVACIDAKINIEHEIERLIGPCEWVLIPEVIDELKVLETERSPAKRLLLSLLEAKAIIQINENQHSPIPMIFYLRWQAHFNVRL